MNKQIRIFEKVIRWNIMFSPIYFGVFLMLLTLNASKPYYVFMTIEILIYITLIFTILFINAYLHIKIEEDTFNIIEIRLEKWDKQKGIKSILQGLPYFLCLFLLWYEGFLVYTLIQIISVLIDKEGFSIIDKMIQYCKKKAMMKKVEVTL